MSLSLAETQAVQKVANFIYDFLPGKAHPFADQNISFAGIASEMGIRSFYPEGSKLPAVTSFLERILENRKNLFCTVILETVKRGIKYRGNKGNPITREEMKGLNDLILKVGFKIPELWDNNFLSNLPSAQSSEIKQESKRDEKIDQNRRKELLRELQNIEKLESHKRGFAFERFLNELFGAFKLEPRGSFKLIGEQIDGSLELDGETYLIEAKWESKQTAIGDLLTFHGKIAGKASWARGILISYGGFSEDALISFSKGRPTNLITLTSQDLYFVLDGHQGLFLDLNEAIRLKVRNAAETGNIGISVLELLIKKK